MNIDKKQVIAFLKETVDTVVFVIVAVMVIRFFLGEILDSVTFDVSDFGY